MALPVARDGRVPGLRRSREAWRGGVQVLPCDFELGESAGAGVDSACAGECGVVPAARGGEGQGVEREPRMDTDEHGYSRDKWRSDSVDTHSFSVFVGLARVLTK